MMKLMIILLQVLCSLVYINATQDDLTNSEATDMLFLAMKGLRSKIFENPSLRSIPVIAEVLDMYETEIKRAIGIDIYDATSLYKLAEDIAEAENLADLAEALNIPESYFDYVVLTTEEIDTAGKYIESMKREVQKMHKWIKTSGFPDEWPLSVSYGNTKRVLQKCPELGRNILTFNGGWEYTAKELAKLLTDPKLSSFDDYLRVLELDESLLDEERTSFLQANRLLGSKIGRKDFLAAMDSCINALKTMNYVGVVDLFEQRL